MNAEPALAFAGALTEVVVTLMSAVEPTSVVPLPAALLLAAFESVRCNWSIAAVAVTWNWWLDGVVQVTAQFTLDVVVAIETASDVFCTVCGLPDDVVQSGGRLIEKVASVLAGPTGPLLCSVAVAETLNGVPAEALVGAVTAARTVLTSVVAVMLAVLLPVPLLLALLGSATCSWLTAAEAPTENVWFDGPVQVTDQLGPLTVVAVDVGSDVLATVCGFAEEVVQSAGKVKVNVVFTFVGP